MHVPTTLQPFPRPERVPQPEQPVSPDEHPLLEDEAAQEQEGGKETFLEDSPTTPLTKDAKSLEQQVPTTASGSVVIPKDEVVIEVERILEEGLGDLYASLPESARPLFKQKGEEAATEISGMVQKLHIELRRALELIRNWLMTIPKVNKFFLEQEAKIKVDLLVQLVEDRKNKPQT